MTETLESPIESVSERAPHQHRPNRLNQAAAWVAIVAGLVFIVGTVFFSGYFLGRHGGHGGGMHGKGRYERLEQPRMPMGPGMMPPPQPGMMPPPQGPGPSTPPVRP